MLTIDPPGFARVWCIESSGAVFDGTTHVFCHCVFPTDSGRFCVREMKVMLLTDAQRAWVPVNCPVSSAG